MTKTVYCIYTDKTIPVETATREHILPLALGGANGFEILADRDCNSRLGYKIDGALAEDFLVKMKRNLVDARGHSRKRPVVVARHSTLDDTDKPVQVHFDRSDFKVWDPRAKRNLAKEQPGWRILNSRFQINMNTRLRFVAKTALSAGYFYL